MIDIIKNNWNATDEEIRAFMIERGIKAMQNIAGFTPEKTEAKNDYKITRIKLCRTMYPHIRGSKVSFFPFSPFTHYLIMICSTRRTNKLVHKRCFFNRLTMIRVRGAGVLGRVYHEQYVQMKDNRIIPIYLPF